MTFAIAGRTAIVTGAARGAGLAIARGLAGEGANVIMADLDEAALERAAAAIAGSGGQVRVFAGDLREKLTVKNLLALAQDAFGGIDILVTAAHQGAATDPLAEEDRTLEDLLERNLLAGYRLCRAVARRMIRLDEGGDGDGDGAPAGAIVNLVAGAGLAARPDMLAASVSAAAMAQMTRALALALAPHRIRVNGVAPGGGADPAAAAGEAVPDGLARAVQYLASPAAAGVTGQIVTLGGILPEAPG